MNLTKVVELTKESWPWLLSAFIMIGVIILLVGNWSVPLYIPLMGFLGSAAYVGKSWTYYLARRGYKPKYIPEQIIRLLLGPTFAIISFYLVNVEVFGIRFSVPEEEQFYAYSVVAFIAGYFTKYVIDALSNMAKAVFQPKKEEPEEEPGEPGKQGEKGAPVNK